MVNGNPVTVNWISGMATAVYGLHSWSVQCSSAGCGVPRVAWRGVPVRAWQGSTSPGMVVPVRHGQSPSVMASPRLSWSVLVCHGPPSSVMARSTCHGPFYQSWPVLPVLARHDPFYQSWLVMTRSGVIIDSLLTVIDGFD